MITRSSADCLATLPYHPHIQHEQAETTQNYLYADLALTEQAIARWTYLGRSYRCQVRIRLIPKPGLPHMMVVETAGCGRAVSARSARRELKTSRAM